MHKKEEIIEFILSFKTRILGVDGKTIEKVFLEGNCYYFAIILKNRFPNMHIVYSQIENHFMAMYGNEIYDIRGCITNDVLLYDLYNWEDYESVDALDYSRVVRDCIKFNT